MVLPAPVFFFATVFLSRGSAEAEAPLKRKGPAVGLLTPGALPVRVPRSSREIVRTAVGLAVVAPAIGLLVLAVMLMRDGGASGVFAGLFVGLLAVGLLAVSLMMTYAPVSIANLLDDEDETSEDETDGAPGVNGGPADDDGPLRRP